MFFVISKVGLTTHELSDELHDDEADDFYAFYGFGSIIEICLIVIRICPSIVAFGASSSVKGHFSPSSQNEREWFFPSLLKKG